MTLIRKLPARLRTMKWFVVLTAFVVMLAVVGCGGSDDVADDKPADSAPKATSTASAATATTAPTTVPVNSNLPAPSNAVGKILFADPKFQFSGGLNSQAGVNTPGVTEGLFISTESGIEGLVAESWTVADDLSSIDITIKKGIQFHGGFGELTAEDVAWSFNEGNPSLNPASVTDGGGAWTSFLGDNPITVTDTNSVHITVKNFDPRWQSWFFSQDGLGASITSKNAFDEKGTDWMLENLIGTGPFEATELVASDHGTFEKFDGYWNDAGKANIDIFVDQSAPDASVRLAMLDSGQADVSWLDLTQVPGALEDGFVAVPRHKSRQHTVVFVGNYWADKKSDTGEVIDHTENYKTDLPWVGNPFNPDDDNNPAALACSGVSYPEILEVGKGCGDMEQARLVRQALAMAIDRETLNEELIEGLGSPVYLPYPGCAQPTWDCSKRTYSYDTDQANKLLDEAGYPKDSKGTRFKLPLIASIDYAPVYSELADAIGLMWRAVGVDTSINKVQYRAYTRPPLVAYNAEEPFITACGSADSGTLPDFPTWFYFTSLSRPGFNCGAEIPALGKWNLESGVEPDAQKRIELAAKAADYMINQAVAVGTIAAPEIIVFNTRSIKDWPMPPMQRASWNSPQTIVPAR
jgi:ABC-type transport system substrate-binding protein